MKKILLFLILLMPECLFAQLHITYNPEGMVIGDTLSTQQIKYPPPICLLDGIPIILDTIQDTSPYQKDVKTLFGEGDSSWVVWYYGSYKNDTSIIQKYFGPSRNHSILFLFSNNRIMEIPKNQFYKYLHIDRKILIKIDSKPLTDSRKEVFKIKKNKIKTIQMVKDFPLKKWDTEIIDTFTLFIIETKK